MVANGGIIRFRVSMTFPSSYSFTDPKFTLRFVAAINMTPFICVALISSSYITVTSGDTPLLIDDADNSIFYTGTWTTQTTTQGATAGTMHLTRVAGATGYLSFTGMTTVTVMVLHCAEPH